MNFVLEIIWMSKSEYVITIIVTIILLIIWKVWWMSNSERVITIIITIILLIITWKNWRMRNKITATTKAAKKTPGHHSVSSTMHRSRTGVGGCEWQPWLPPTWKKVGNICRQFYSALLFTGVGDEQQEQERYQKRFQEKNIIWEISDYFHDKLIVYFNYAWIFF